MECIRRLCNLSIYFSLSLPTACSFSSSFLFGVAATSPFLSLLLSHRSFPTTWHSLPTEWRRWCGLSMEYIRRLCNLDIYFSLSLPTPCSSSSSFPFGDAATSPFPSLLRSHRSFPTTWHSLPTEWRRWCAGSRRNAFGVSATFTFISLYRYLSLLRDLPPCPFHFRLFLCIFLAFTSVSMAALQQPSDGMHMASLLRLLCLLFVGLIGLFQPCRTRYRLKGGVGAGFRRNRNSENGRSNIGPDASCLYRLTTTTILSLFAFILGRKPASASLYIAKQNESFLPYPYCIHTGSQTSLVSRRTRRMTHLKTFTIDRKVFYSL